MSEQIRRFRFWALVAAMVAGFLSPLAVSESVAAGDERACVDCPDAAGGPGEKRGYLVHSDVM